MKKQIKLQTYKKGIHYKKTIIYRTRDIKTSIKKKNNKTVKTDSSF